MVKEDIMNKEKRLSNREVLAYALTSAAGLGGILVTSFISGYWTDYVGISIAVVGTIMLLCRVIDGISDLIMGVIIDKTHTKYGKAKPWLMIGAVGNMICSSLIFKTPDFSMTGKIIYGTVLYILVFAVFGTMSGVASPTLVNLITTDEHDRFKLGSWAFSALFIVEMLVGFGLNVAVALGNDGFFKLSLIANGISAIILVFCWFNIKERHGQEELRREKVTLKEFFVTLFNNKYFLLVTIVYLLTNISAGVAMGATFYYVIYILKNPAAFGLLSVVSYVPCIISTALGPIYSKKFGILKLVIVCNIFTIIPGTLCIVAPDKMLYVMVMTAIASFFNGPMCAILSPLNAMAADYGEYKNGIARPAVYSSGTSVGTKIGMGIGTAIAAFILAVVGFDGMAEVQNGTVNVAIVLVYFGIPELMLAIETFLLVPFKKLFGEYDEITVELKKRHGEE